MSIVYPKYPKIPEEYGEYYRVARPDELEWDAEDFAYKQPIVEGYTQLFYGWAVARENSLIYDILADNGLDYAIIGWDSMNGFKLYQVVGGRLYYADDEIENAIQIVEDEYHED